MVKLVTLKYTKHKQINNQRDSLSDLKKTLFDLDTNQWERWNEMFKAI